MVPKKPLFGRTRAILPSSSRHLHCLTLFSCFHYCPCYPFIPVGWMTSLLLNTNTPHPCPPPLFSKYILSTRTLLCTVPSLFCPFPWCSFCTPLTSFPSTSFPSFIHLLSIHQSHISSLLLFLSLFHFPHPFLPSLNTVPRFFSHPIPSHTSFPSYTSFSFLTTFPSLLPFTITASSSPSNSHSFPCPLPTCRTIRRSTWSTYTAGLTACAPRMKAPTSSSPPLPSI